MMYVGCFFLLDASLMSGGASDLVSITGFPFTLAIADPHYIQPQINLIKFAES